MKKHQLWILAILFVVCLFVPSGLFGQAVTATVVGTVTDSSGAVLPNVVLTLTEQSTSVVSTTLTNASGNYEFTFLPPGTYTVQAVVNGFNKQQQKNVLVAVNTTTRVDLSLQPGSTTQTVTVTSDIALLQTDRADVSAQIDEKQVEDLPVGSQRNFQALESLVPGVSRPIYDHSSFFDAQNSQSFQVNGQSELSNNLQFEGIDDNERTGLLQVYIPPAAAIKSVDVETSNYAPEFGRSAGAVTNVTMKSGTNEIHGSVYEFNQVSALSARSYFNNTGPFPRSTNNYYGATIGGPIIKNRTFFFIDFLRYSLHQGQFNTLSVPTAAFRTGDLSGGPTTIYDPRTGNPDGTGRKPFVTNGIANVIPTDRLNPIALKILALVPLPNVAGAGFTNNYQANTIFNNDVNSYDAKVDQQLGTADRLTGRFSYQTAKTYQSPIFGASGGPAAGAFEGTGINKVFNTAAEYTHLFSPKLFTEVRVGVDHYRNTAQEADYGTKASTDLGIPGVNLDAFTSGLVGMDIAGFSSPLVGYSASLPWVRAETNIDAVNNWTKIVGNHSLKFGAELRRVRDDLTQGQTFSPRGIFRYRDGQTGLNVSGNKTGFANDFASFLLDLPSQVGRDLNVHSASWRQTLYFGFAQDTWVVTQRLTLTYGLRWELYPPAVPSSKGGFSNYDPATNTLQVSGYGNVPNNLGLDFNATDFEPRVGFAYRAHPETIIRGGFGVSRTPFQDNNYAFNSPVRQNASFNSLNSYSPALLPSGAPATLAAGFPTLAGVQIPSNGIIAAPLNQNYVAVNKHYRDPEVTSYNLTVEQQLPGAFVFDIAYVGNQGKFIPGNYNLNAGLVAGAGAAGRPYFALYGTSADIELLPKETTSNYNALQARLNHRFSNGFEFTSGFTFQKAMGFNSTGGGLGGFSFYLDPHRDYAPLSFNRTITSSNSFIFALPFGKDHRYMQHGVAAFLAGGWQTSGVVFFQTGTPLFFTASGSRLNTPGTTQVPNQNGPFRKLKGIGTQNLWFDPSVFSQPSGIVLGNMGKNVYSGPGSVTFDAAAFRTFPIWEKVQLQFRMDAFNVLNHPNFNNPNTDLTSANFGKVTGAGGPRGLQLAGTISF
ncbi:MAG: hypothetical protein NVSMB62_13540 [Acidobacteriaceae bacterium]